MMRELISSFDQRFEDLHSRLVELTRKTDQAMLYARPAEAAPSMLPFSIGEFILRSAAAVEQMTGGITTRLWDDPFEWTLPEQLPTRDYVLNYLDEVEETRLRAFAFFKDDDDLDKLLPAPVEFRTLDTLLTDTLANAERLFDQASEIYRTLVAHNAK